MTIKGVYLKTTNLFDLQLPVVWVRIIKEVSTRVCLVLEARTSRVRDRRPASSVQQEPARSAMERKAKRGVWVCNNV